MGVKEIKGSAIVGTITQIKKLYGESEYQNLLGLLNENDKKIFNATILASLWYPINSFVNLLEADVSYFHNGNREQLQKGTEDIVSKQLSGIYKLFVKLGSPEYIVKKIGLINNSYFRGIDLEIVSSDTGNYIGKYYGFDKNHHIFEYIITGFYKRALEISGAKNIKIKFTTPISAGKDFAEIQVNWQ